MLTDLLPVPYGLVVVGGEDSSRIVTADYRTMPNTLMGRLVTTGLLELRSALRSDPDVVYYTGSYLEPNILEAIIDMALTGHAVCIAVPGSFEDALPVLDRVYHFNHGVTILDGREALDEQD